MSGRPNGNSVKKISPSTFRVIYYFSWNIDLKRWINWKFCVFSLIRRARCVLCCLWDNFVARGLNSMYCVMSYVCNINIMAPKVAVTSHNAYNQKCCDTACIKRIRRMWCKCVRIIMKPIVLKLNDQQKMLSDALDTILLLWFRQIIILT